MLRQGRLTPGQQRAFDTLWPRYGIEFKGQQLDLPALFGNTHPVFMEIGFGNGDSLAQMAESNPDHNYLGVEVHSPGVGRLLKTIDERELKNLRIIRHDAVDVLKQGLDPASLHGLFLFFPDPWHKKRHHKRRILNEEFVALITRTIRPGGFFHAATDWEDYARQMMEVLSEAPLLNNRAGAYAYTPRPDYRPLTKFEQRGQRLGHGVWDLIFERQQD